MTRAQVLTAVLVVANLGLIAAGAWLLWDSYGDQSASETDGQLALTTIYFSILLKYFLLGCTLFAAGWIGLMLVLRRL